MTHEFYFDNAATTPIQAEVLAAGLPFLQQHFGNPSSIHAVGTRVAQAVREARLSLANLFDARPEGVIFTSGGTEANNLAVLGAMKTFGGNRGNVLLSEIEHDSVLKLVAPLEEMGVEVRKVRVTEQGVLNLEHLKTQLDSHTRLVSVMAVNNEVGTRQPLQEIGSIIKQHNPRVLFHSDCVQAFTKCPLPIKEAQLDLISLSGHKIGAPKGSGALVNRNRHELKPLFYGGGQENGLRGGTENVFGAITLAKAAQVGLKQAPQTYRELQTFRARAVERLQAAFPRLVIFDSPSVLPHYLNFALPGFPAEVMLHHLESRGIFVSTGSACSSHKDRNTLSHVLKALRLEEAVAKSMVRLSFGPNNLAHPLELALEQIIPAIRDLEKLG